MLKWDSIPKTLVCECGRYIKDLSDSEACEFFVANALKAKVAAAYTEGYDLYGSPLFPGLTFQVKYAKAREGRKEIKVVKGREALWDESPHWTWNEPKALSSDWYILFGIRDDIVYPFACPVWIWEDESYDTGNGGRILRISTDEYSHCGRYANAYKRNKFWQHRLLCWPSDLLDRIAYYTNQGPREQLALFEERVPYLVRMN